MLNESDYSRYLRTLPLGLDQNSLSFRGCMEVLAPYLRDHYIEGVETSQRPWQTVEAITRDLMGESGEVRPWFGAQLQGISPESLFRGTGVEMTRILKQVENIMLVGCVSLNSLLGLLKYLHTKAYSGKLTVIDRSPRPLAACVKFLEMFPEYGHDIPVSLIPTNLAAAHRLDLPIGMVVTDAVDPYLGRSPEKKFVSDLWLLKSELIESVFEILRPHGYWVARLLGKSGAMIGGEPTERFGASEVFDLIVNNNLGVRVEVVNQTVTYQGGREIVEAVFKF